MINPKVLPWEDLQGIGGWALYIFAAVLIGGAIARVGYLALGFWLATIRLYFSVQGKNARKLLIGSPWENFIGIGMIFALGILLWLFIHLVVLQGNETGTQVMKRGRS